MPEKQTLKRARKARREGKSPSTQAGEFMREEIHHVREGKHGARSTKQAIAIGLSKARRAGVKLGVPKRLSARAKQSARSAARARRQEAVAQPRPGGTRGAQARATRHGLARRARAVCEGDRETARPSRPQSRRAQGRAHEGTRPATRRCAQGGAYAQAAARVAALQILARESSSTGSTTSRGAEGTRSTASVTPCSR